MGKRSAKLKELRVLNVEDSERDAALLTRHLTKAGYKIYSQRVQTAEAMEAALEERQWDVILCDYSMPKFDALGALAALRSSGIDIPFIIISGTVGEEIAVEAMLSGAHDYLTKGNLARLVPAVERELRDANIRQKLKWEGEERRISETRYRTLFDHAPDGIIISDSDGKYLDANASICRMFGYTRDEIIGMSGTDFVPAMGSEDVDAAIDEIRSGAEYSHERQYRRKDGSIFTGEVTATVMPDGNILGLVRDISERKEAREIKEKLTAKIEAQRTRLDTIIESVPGIVWETSWDVHRTVEEQDFVSSYAMTMLGYSVDEWLETPNFWMTIVHEDDRDRVRSNAEAAMVRGEASIDEFRWIKKDGQIIWVEARSSVICDEEGNQIGVRGVTIDITDRKRAENERRIIAEIIENGINIPDLDHYLKSIHASISEAMYAENCFIMLRDPITSLDWFPYWSDKYDPPPAPRKSTKGFSSYVQRSGEPLMITEEVKKTIIESGEAEQIGSFSPSWLGVPLRTPTETIGVLVLQHYETSDAYSQRDLDFLASVGDQLAMAIERKRAELELRDSEERFSGAFEHAPIGVALVQPDGRWLKVNRALCDLVGYTEAELLTRSFQDITFAEDLEEDLDNVRELLDGEINHYQMEKRYVHKLGHPVPVLLNVSLVRESGGKPRYFISQVQDIAESKRTVKALAESEERFRELVENATDMMYTFDFEGNFTSVNKTAERLTGYSRDETRALNTVDIVAPEYVETARFNIEARLAGKEITAYEMEIITKAGKRVAVEVNTRVIREDGVPVGFQGIARDITPRKEAEQALKETEKRYRDLVENALDIIYTHDLSGNYTSVNGAGEKITGYPIKELSAMNIADLLAPEYLGKARHMIAEKVAGKDVTAYEVELIAKDGHRIALEVNTRIVYENDVAVGVQGIARDITDRKLAEATLRESDEKFHQLADHISDVFWIRSPDMSKIYYISPAFEQIWGRKLKNDHTDPHEWQDFIIPQDRQSVKDAYAGLMSDRPEIEVEFRILRPDGEQRWVRARGFQVKDESGEVIRLAGIVTDITERKVAEETLREADQRAIREYGLLLTRVAKLALAFGNARDLEAIFEELREFALVSTGMDGFIISLFDAERQTRTAAYVWSDGFKVDASTLPPMEMSDSPHSRSVLTGDIIITDDFQTAMEGQPVISLGGDCPRSSLVVPMSVMGKIVGGVEVQSNELAAFRDNHATAMQMAANLAANAIENVRLLEIERMQGEQLRQSQKMEAVGVLAGGIAHDFNNLLTAINGYSEITLRRMAADDPFRGNIQEVKKAGDRAAELTTQLLAFSRKQVLQPTVHNLNSVVTNIENMLRRIIKENIELRTLLSPELGNIKADPGQIEQVLMNLAINARDAMPSGGKLTISTSNVYLDEGYVSQHHMVAPGQFVKLTISDNGLGMADDIKQHIFEPFFTTKGIGEGTGLGLSMVYGIVKQSGGDIMVYSEVDRGTVIKIYLPCVDENVEKRVWRDDETDNQMGTETILLVEDEDIVRRLVHEILTSNGYTVLDSASGVQALTVFENFPDTIHMLLTDVIMPNMDGAELRDMS